jgi:uncharacterized protein (DUF2132 family)
VTNESQPNNPLHGLTLETVVTQLVDHYGWQFLGETININCFKSDPSIKSSLTFLRKTLWAREKVEKLYVTTFVTSPSVAAKKANPWTSGAYKKV